MIYITLNRVASITILGDLRECILRKYPFIMQGQDSRIEHRDQISFFLLLLCLR